MLRRVGVVLYGIIFVGLLVAFFFFNPIKGNGDSMIYHLPGCGSYKATSMTNHSKDQWFFSEQDAINAGFTKAGNCPL